MPEKIPFIAYGSNFTCNQMNFATKPTELITSFRSVIRAVKKETTQTAKEAQNKSNKKTMRLKL